ncbi:septation ring formation regulator EzrA [Limosilactobacillus caecicola]|uniref:septation ring formation regulator EzrA n=1 Tax=Limosilactobacillus caecicola TaxID=2941332 RepID=UPI00203FF6A7|nr:septation ring formation regulator EzrA [Limosilactobacillus caecicola]
MLQILIGILVIALIVLVVIFFYQRRVQTLVKGLDQQIKTLEQTKLEEELSSERLEGLMGESLKKFTSLREQYDKQFMPDYQKAEKLVKQIQSNLHSKNVLNTSSDVNDLRQLVDHLLTIQRQLEASIDQLNQAVETQTNAIKELRQQYNKFGRILDEKAFDYGESQKELQQRLVNLEKKYEHFSEVTHEGDHEAAQELLNDLQEQTSDFQTMIDEIPELYRPLYAIFPDQLKELKSGYADLVKAHYHFTEENLEQQIDDLESERQMALKKLANLNPQPVKAANKELAAKIDHLYEVMQQEIDAKPYVLKDQPKISSHLEHAQKQNMILMTELQRLSNSYTLNNDEIADTRQLDEQLKEIAKQCQDDTQSIKEQTAVYSVIRAHYQELEENLTEIEKQQQSVNDGVAGLQTDETRARKALQKFITEIRTIKRHVEALNLPGIPQDYLDYFFVVSDEISKLSEAMNQPQINMEDITKQLLIVQDDLENLQEKTDNLRDSAALTERLIQYANRLSTDNETIDKAIQKAQDLFERNEYSTALETIGTALEEAEAGSFKRIEQDYYQSVKNS